MITREEQELIDLINERLDGEALVRAIGYHTDKLRALGKSLKTPCFIHGDEKFATLIVMPEKRTYKCMVNNCRAFTEGPLVRLYAYWKDVEDLDAALGAAELTGLELTGGAFDAVLASWLSKADQMAASGDNADSRILFLRAAKLAPRNSSVLVRAAKSCETSGEPQEALALFLKAARTATASGNADEGVRILREEALRIASDEREVLEELAQALAANGKAEEGAEALAGAAEATQDIEEARALIERAQEIAPDSAKVRLRYARLLLREGERERAVEIFGRIADQFLENDDLVSAQQALQGAVEAAPERDDLLDILLEASTRSGTLDQAADFLEVLAKKNEESPRLLLAAARGKKESSGSAAARPLFQRALASLTAREEADSIRSLYEELSEDSEESGTWREGFGEWLAARGEIQVAIAQFRASADSLSDSEEDAKEAVRLLTRMVEIDDFAPELRRALARAHVRNRQLPEAEAAFLEAAKLHAQQQKEEESVTDLEELVSEIPHSEKGLESLIKLLVSIGKEERAVKSLKALAKQRAEDGRNAENVPLFRQLVGFVPDDLTIKVQLAKSLEESNDLPSASATWQSIAAAHSKSNSFAEAVAALTEAIRLQPDNLDLMEEHINALESSGDLVAFRSEATLFAEKAESLGESNRSQAMGDRLEAKFPNDALVVEHVAELDIRRGETQEGCHRLMEVAESLAANGDAVSASRLLRRVLEIEPGRTEARDRLIGILEEGGHQPEVLKALLSFAAFQFAQGDQSAALDCIARYEAQSDLEWVYLKESCDLLVSNGLTDRAIASLRNLAKSAATPPDVIAACEYGLTLAPGEKAFAEKLFALYEIQNQIDNALRVGILLAAILEGNGDQKGTLKQLETLKAKYPSSREPRLELARLHEKASRKAEAKKELSTLAAMLRGEARIAEARTLYQRALAIDPNDLEIGFEFANVLEELNERDEAVSEVRRIAALAAKKRDIPRATTLYERLFELAPDDLDARGDFVAFMDASSNPEKAASESLQLAHRWFREGDGEKGARWAERSWNTLPDSADVAREAAGLLYENSCEHQAEILLSTAAQRHLQSGRLLEAEQLIESGLARDKEQPALLGVSAEVALSKGLKDEAINILRQVAAIHDRAGHLKQAEVAWSEVIELSPESIADHEELIDVLQRQGPARKADTLEVLKRLCAFYLSKDRRSDAITCYRRQLEIDPQLLEVREELARACLDEDHFREATEQFLLLASAYRQSGKLKLAIDYLAKVIELEPQNTEALQTQVELTASEGRVAEFADYSLRLASIHEAAGRMDEAIQTVRAVVEADRENLDVRPILASYLIKAGDANEGVATYLETARRHLGKKKKAKAVEVLDRVRSLANLGIPALEGLGQLYLDAGEKQTALSVMRGAADKMRASSDAESLERIFEVLLPLLSENGKADEVLELQLELARLQISQGMVEQARSHLEKLAETHGEERTFHEAAAAVWADNGIPELAAQEYLRVARICMNQEEWRDGRKWCRKAVEGRPREIVGREMLAECLRNLGEADEACNVLAHLAELYEDSLQTDGAAGILGKIVELQPEEPAHLERYADLLEKLRRTDELAGTLRNLAQVREKRGETELAIESLRRLKGLRPDDTRVRANFIKLNREMGRGSAVFDDLVHLANLQLQRGDRATAIATLHEAAELDSYRPEARERLLTLHLEESKSTEAVETAFALVETYIQLTAYREATITLQRVKKLVEDDPRYRLALANIHMAQNARGMALREYQEAARLFDAKGDVAGRTDTIRRIIEIDPQNLEVHRDLIECLRAQNQYPEATEVQRQLAEAYASRGLWDLSEAEYRAIVNLDPEDIAAWQALFHAHLHIGQERDLIADYIRVSQSILRRGDVNDAIHLLAKVITLDPRNTEAREKYIEAYKKVGKESELCEDYLLLADLYVDSGRIDEGIALYNHVMTVDPGNTVVREKLSETQARRRSMAVAEKKPPGQDSSETPVRETQLPKKSLPPPRIAIGGAADFLADEIENLDQDDQTEALEQVVSSYLDILSINPQNANVRIKLADLYMQMNERDKAVDELRVASETFLMKAELTPCINVCERILKLVPTDQKIRQRLKQAFNKRDAFKALESAILFSDGTSEGGETLSDPTQNIKTRGID